MKKKERDQSRVDGSAPLVEPRATASSNDQIRADLLLALRRITEALDDIRQRANDVFERAAWRCPSCGRASHYKLTIECVGCRSQDAADHIPVKAAK